ncbi:MAG: hypothetical protein ACRC5M_02735 [Anaeroplasmataceae bacterium]
MPFEFDKIEKMSKKELLELIEDNKRNIDYSIRNIYARRKRKVELHGIMIFKANIKFCITEIRECQLMLKKYEDVK